jgi:hypothetical protein
MRMLESIVDLLDGLFLIAAIVLMVFCIVGSIIAALRAVSGGTATSRGSPGKFVEDMGERSEGFSDAKPQVQSADSVLKPNGPGESPISCRKAEHISPAR